MGTKFYKTTFISLLLVFTNNLIFSQNRNCDSVELVLNGYKRGNIEWQKKCTQNLWETVLNGIDSTIIISGNDTCSYRAIVSNGTCTDIISIEKSNILPYSFTNAEESLIMSGSATTLMSVMNIYSRQDSLILRAENYDLSPSCDLTILQRLKDRMLKTVKDPNHTGVGIAAPQVGINRKATWVQRYDKPFDWGTFNYPFDFILNPTIIEYGDTIKLRSDGCLSVPTGGNNPAQIDSTYRSTRIKVKYQKIDGTWAIENITHEYTAHIFQHEIDHLYGTMYFDRNGQKNMYIEKRKTNFTK